MLEYLHNKISPTISPHRFLNFFLLFLIIIFYLPTALLDTQFADWRTISSHWFAIEKSIIDYSQWPLHNPWIGAGQPNYGSSLSDTISLRTPFILLFGSERGYLISFIPLTILTYFGSRNLGNKIFDGQKFYALIFAFLYATSSSYVSHLIVGHGMIIQSTSFFPWIMYYFLKYQSDIFSPYKAGLFYALSLYENLAYGSQYILVILFLFFLIELLNKNKKTYILIRWLFLFVLTALSISIFKFITVLDALNGFERLVSYDYHYPLVTFLKSFVNSSWISPSYIDTQLYCAGSWEISNYLGYTSLFLIIYSFLLKPEKYHYVAIFFVISLLGNEYFFSLFYWLKYLPFFDSHLCFGRIRVLTSLFLIILIVIGLRKLIIDINKLKFNKNTKKFFKVIILLLLFYPSAVTFFKMNTFYNSIEKSVSVNLPDINSKEFPIQMGIKKYEVRMFKDFSFTNIFSRGYGIYDSNQYSNLGHPEDSLLNTFESLDYIGEYYQSDLKVKPDFWSPNYIKFSNLEIDKELKLNLVPSNAWIINGKRIFENMRIYEPQTIFSVKPDQNGNIEMKYQPKLLFLAIYIEILLLFLLSLIFLFDKYFVIRRLW